MCKAGGPRCPQTKGKKARRSLHDKVQRRIDKAGQAPEDWKESNPREYDRMMKEAFPPESSIEDDMSWVNYRDIGEHVSPKEDEESDSFADVNQYLLAKYGNEIEQAINWDGYDQKAEEEILEEQQKLEEEESYTNRHLLPRDAVIHSPTPNPVFVYGTLRTGKGNYRNILQGATQKETPDVSLPGATMYTNGGFPYVLDDKTGESSVKGDLMYLDYDQFGEALENLDYLEGTGADISSDNNHYNRTLRYVQVGDKEYVQAWVYIPPAVDQSYVKNLAKVESGDWNNQ